jgi:rRNA biogenesis protein RRP5
LCKKYFAELDIWSAYVEFLHEAKSDEFTQPKVVLQKALQALPKNLHINMISKYGMLEYKAGKCESGRTMFEGIVTNYPKRMDIWAIYMDMEVKHGGAQNKH